MMMNSSFCQLLLMMFINPFVHMPQLGDVLVFIERRLLGVGYIL
uniref:Uncharacterized protein n=1 Tax=Anguilla anguilla TaxID=7936 RepID=A0A0E9TEJ1_ANGAN